jgi:Xaa-Pro aminopeptidase
MDYSITRQELLERAAGLRQRMSAAGLDALLLTTGDNLKYVSGYPSPLRSGPRPFLFILPLTGEPVFIVHAGREGEARRFSWASDIRTYYPLSHAPVDQTVAALRQLKLDHGARIGVEIGAEQCLDIPLSDFWAIQARLPEAVFADSAPVLWGARLHKTSQEIARIRQACSITSAAYDQAYAGMQAGMTEQAAAQIMKNAMLAQGAEDTWLLMTSGAGNYDLISRGPGPRQLLKGDFVYIDGGCSVAGYWSDFDRVGVVGIPTPAQVNAQHMAEEITQSGVDLVRPGASTREIARRCAQAIKRFPYPVTSDIGYLAARIGHGIGITAIEPPNIAEYEDTILEPGMVITIEPGVATGFGVFHVEQNVLVTESGHEVLSTAHTRIREIGD